MESASKSAQMPKRAGYRTRTPEQMHRDGVKGGSTTYERGVGIFGATAKQKRAWGIKAGEARKRMGIASIPREATVQGGHTQGKKNRDEGTGFFSMTSEQWSAAGKKGIAAMPHEAKVLGGVVTCHLRWHVARGRVSPKCILCTGE
jgi:hypothetical protein